MLLPHVTWQVVAYAALSLTLIRMVPVAIALLGTGAQLPTVAFMGWFGPRGLASIVFALIALDEGIPGRQLLLTTVMMIILLSVFLHGLSSVPLVAAYSRWYAAHVAQNPTASEAKPTIMPRLRHQRTPGMPNRGKLTRRPNRRPPDNAPPVGVAVEAGDLPELLCLGPELLLGQAHVGVDQHSHFRSGRADDGRTLGFEGLALCPLRTKVGDHAYKEGANGADRRSLGPGACPRATGADGSVIAHWLRTALNVNQKVTMNVPRGQYVVKSAAEEVAGGPIVQLDRHNEACWTTGLTVRRSQRRAGEDGQERSA